MGFWKTFRSAWKEAQSQKRVKLYLRVVSSESFTVDLMKKICSDYGHSFRFQFNNGDYLEFPKITDRNVNPYLDIEEESFGG